MKYVAIDVRFNGKKSGHGKRFIVPFPEDIVHAIMAEAMTNAFKLQWPECTCKVHAAGTMLVTAESCHGKSDSLKVKADPNDSRMFNAQDYSFNLL